LVSTLDQRKKDDTNFMVSSEDTEEILDKVIQQLEMLTVQTTRLAKAVEDLSNEQRERRPTDTSPTDNRQSSNTTNHDTHSPNTLRVGDRVFVRIRRVPFSARQGVILRFTAQRVVVRLDNGSVVYRSPQNTHHIQE
jgi:hypothetical protein